MSVSIGRHSTHKGAVELSDTDRTEHAYIIGKTGSGKSTLMERMAIQDIQRGANVVYIDPHGQSAIKLLDYIPRERIDDVVYFNPADIHHIFQLNPLKKGLTDDLGQVAGSVLQAFKSIWWESWSDSLMQKTFLAGIHTVLATQEPTLLGLHRIYTEDEWRRKIFLHNPVLRRSWEFMDKLKAYERTQMMSSVVTRLEQFLIDPCMQRIFCSYRPRFSFADIFQGLLEVVWVILGVERVEYTHYCRLSCIPRGR
jgi:energy-coupling factor transporter ATP-binding protein EcfA2